VQPRLLFASAAIVQGCDNDVACRQKQQYTQREIERVGQITDSDSLLSRLTASAHLEQVVESGLGGPLAEGVEAQFTLIGVGLGRLVHERELKTNLIAGGKRKKKQANKAFFSESC